MPEQLFRAPPAPRAHVGAARPGQARARRSGLALSRLAIALLVLALANGCNTAADLIPGDETFATATPRATPPPVLAPPILSKTVLELGGDKTAANGLAVADAQLALSVIRIEARQGSNVVRSGTGVVVDASQRLILTSYQLVEPFAADATRAYGTIELAVTRTVGEPPQPAYLGQLVRAEPAKGFAVVRAMRHLDGTPLNPGEFDLPAVELGDGALIARGDPIRILGFPGLDGGRPDGSAVSVTRANVLGFRGDTGETGVMWVKTQARVPSGQNGAPAFDERGRLLGAMLQAAYAPTAPAGQMRPTRLARSLIDDARQAGPEASYAAPLFRRSAFVPGPVVTRPAFAENQLEGGTGDLLDYKEKYADSLATLNYEFVLQGAAPGVLIEERWFLNGLLQDGLSSSVPWSGGPFELVTDRLKAPAGRALQSGTWRLEVWADRQMRAAAEATVGDAQSREAKASEFRLGSTANPDGSAREPARANAPQITASFKYESAGGVRNLRWIVFHDARIVYQSPRVPWEGGEAGTWWVGYSPGTNIGAGTWEFEVYLDEKVVGAEGVRLF